MTKIFAKKGSLFFNCRLKKKDMFTVRPEIFILSINSIEKIIIVVSFNNPKSPKISDIEVRSKFNNPDASDIIEMDISTFPNFRPRRTLALTNAIYLRFQHKNKKKR